MDLGITSFARHLFAPRAAVPLRRVPSARWARPSGRASFLELRVADVIDETPTTKTFVFDASALRYRAGQHLTVVVDIAGHTERRCYSFSSSPATKGRSAITVRRIDGGKVSGYLHDRVHAGDVLRAAPPAGAFTVETDPTAARLYAMVAGGVGITPLVSIAETILNEEPRSRIVLLFGNRIEKEIIFRRRLETLASEFCGRLEIMFALDMPTAGWNGLLGSLTGERVLTALAGSNPDRWLLCGPAPMMDGAVATLEGAGVAPKNILFERFQYAEARALQLPQAPATLRFARSGVATSAPVGMTILEATEKAGVALPSSCRMGGCGACKIKVQGRIVTAEPNCLSEHERADGYALACCSYADGEVTLLDF